MNKELKKRIIDGVKINERDCGSADVQIAVLTERIKQLTFHLEKHKKDHHTRHGLLIMVGKRKRLMKYLRRKNPDRHAVLSGKTGTK